MTGRSRAAFFIGEAIVWAAVILGCALALDGDAFNDIILILGGGAAVSVVILPAALPRSHR
ncbi:MAG TPA: hypothetical protein VF148_13480 [Acidimicrobiia bacterium]